MADETAPAQAASTPAPTAGEQPSVTVPEAAPVSTIPPAEEPSHSSGEVAGGVEGYLAEKEKAIKEAALKKDQAQAAPTATTEDDPPAAAPAVAPAEETPATPATDPAAPVVEPVAAAVVDPAVEEEKKPDRIRIGTLSDAHLVKAATDIARSEGISFADAFARVTKPKTEPAAAPPSNLRSRADVERDMETARTDRRQAAEGADKLEAGSNGKMVAAEEKLDALKSELEAIDFAEAEAEQNRETSERAQFSATVEDSRSKAAQYWPDAGVNDSAFSKRMIELSSQYESDPRLSHYVFEADAPFFFAELVAKEFKLAPVHLQKKNGAAPAAVPGSQPSTPPSPTKPAPVAQRAVIRPVQPAAGPASGAARTTQEPVKDEFGVDNIRNVSDYEKVKKNLLAAARK